MKAPTQQQLNDPAWWDEEAPEDAQMVWLVWDGPSAISPLIRIAWARHGEGVICGEGQATKCYQRPAKPQAPEWDGELPPKPGDLVKHPRYGGPCTLRWIGKGNCVIESNFGDEYFAAIEDLEPVRTKEQCELEGLIGVFAVSTGGVCIPPAQMKALAKRICDAGLLHKGD